MGDTIGSVSPIGLERSFVTVGVLRLPIPEITAHSLQVMSSLEAQFLLRQGGIRSQIRYIAPSIEQ